MYPVNPASGNYILGTPAFEEIAIPLPNGNSFRIVSNNWDESKYEVEKVVLNGIELTRNYLEHSEIMAGGKLEFWMK